MTLGNQIASLRKQNNITQEALAQKLGVTNQAVSKWESDLCCPDVTLLPKIADIFEITLDTLFGRNVPSKEEYPGSDQDTLHVVLLRGRKRILDQAVCKEIKIVWQGDVLDLYSDFSVSCCDVQGNIDAGGHVDCDSVAGNVTAGGHVTCDDVAGNVQAGGNVTCDDVAGNVAAGRDVTCDDVEGDVQAGGMATCGSVSGSINSGKDMMAKMWKDMRP